MDKDIQKPILFKCDPELFALLEKFKYKDKYPFNRNRIINDALRLYLELMKLTQLPEYAYLNEVSFQDYHLQRILFERLKMIINKYPARRYRKD